MKLGTTLMSLWMNFRQVMGATGPPPSTLLNDLVSYWPLNEVSGTRYDAVGSNDLTDNNTVGAVLPGIPPGLTDYRIDEWEGPSGKGWALTAFVTDAGQEWQLRISSDKGVEGWTQTPQPLPMP